MFNDFLANISPPRTKVNIITSLQHLSTFHFILFYFFSPGCISPPKKDSLTFGETHFHFLAKSELKRLIPLSCLSVC